MKRTYVCHLFQLKQAFLVINNFKKQIVMDSDAPANTDNEEVTEADPDVETALSILDLPPEVMYLIFSYCEVSHLFITAQFVCRRWHELLQTVHAWKGRKLIFGQEMPCHQLMSNIRCAPGIDALSYRYTSCHRFVPCLLKNCTNLSWLKLHGDFYVPFSSLKHLDSLQFLDLDLRWKFERKREHDPDLTGIELLPSIKTLIVRNFIYHDKFVIECIKYCPKLEHIYMSKVETLEHYVDPERQGDMILPSSNLQTVYVFGAQNASRELLDLISRPEYRNLCNLVIKPNNYTDEDFISTLFCSKYPELITLDIGYSNLITDASMPRLVDSCPKLKNLCLNRCDIGDPGLRVCLKSLPQLERLNLHGTPVSSDLLHYFPSCFPNLKALNLCACRFIHQISVLPLLDSLPNVMILDRRGDFLGGNRVRRILWPFLPVRNALP